MSVNFHFHCLLFLPMGRFSINSVKRRQIFVIVIKTNLKGRTGCGGDLGVESLNVTGAAWSANG